MFQISIDVVNSLFYAYLEWNENYFEQIWLINFSNFHENSWAVFSHTQYSFLLCQHYTPRMAALISALTIFLSAIKYILNLEKKKKSTKATFKIIRVFFNYGFIRKRKKFS